MNTTKFINYARCDTILFYFYFIILLKARNKLVTNCDHFYISTNNLIFFLSHEI